MRINILFHKKEKELLIVRNVINNKKVKIVIRFIAIVITTVNEANIIIIDKF